MLNFRFWILVLLWALLITNLQNPKAILAEFTNKAQGTSSAQFLRMGAGARAEALAGAYGAVAEDASALFWNPSGLALLQSKNLLLMHSLYPEAISYSYAAFAFPVKKSAGLGVSAQYLSAGEIEQTSDEGLTTGSYSPANLSITFGGAYRWRKIVLGASGKYIRSRILDTATAATLDLGILYAQEFFRLGFSCQNFFSYLTFDRTAYPLPLNLKLSSAFFPMEYLLLTADGNFPRDHQPELNAGIEWSFGVAEEWLISPRVGYSSRTKDLSGFQGVTFGGGLDLKSYSLDYAWIPLGNLGQTHRVSLTIRW